MTIGSVTAAQLTAANAITETIAKILSEAGGAHAETTVASAARLAGTFLFRDFKCPVKNIAPGTAVRCEWFRAAGGEGSVGAPGPHRALRCGP